jgi:hypothetical protein
LRSVVSSGGDEFGIVVHAVSPFRHDAALIGEPQAIPTNGSGTTEFGDEENIASSSKPSTTSGVVTFAGAAPSLSCSLLPENFGFKGMGWTAHTNRFRGGESPPKIKILLLEGSLEPFDMGSI